VLGLEERHSVTSRISELANHYSRNRDHDFYTEPQCYLHLMLRMSLYLVVRCQLLKSTGAIVVLYKMIKTFPQFIEIMCRFRCLSDRPVDINPRAAGVAIRLPVEQPQRRTRTEPRRLASGQPSATGNLWRRLGCQAPRHRSRRGLGDPGAAMARDCACNPGGH